MEKMIAKQGNVDSIIQFSGSKLILKLEAQSPLIHFQHDEPGVTLRGSELKPKLDKFLCRKINRMDLLPLDYKVKISSDVQPDRAELGYREEQYSIFYGDSREKKGVWSDPQLTIICFDNQTKKIIVQNIIEFFYVTNFGTMQNKGFGSFIPTEILHSSGGQKLEQPSQDIISRWLKDRYKTTRCWRCHKRKQEDTREKRCMEQFKWIKSFYSIMKSGQNNKGYERSFLFNYMHKKNSDGWEQVDTSNVNNNINNEKAWMKQQKIAPVFSTKNFDHDAETEEAKYIRAFLGLAGIQQWKVDKDNKTTIFISDIGQTKEFERIPSPVIFKIIGGDIYFIIEKIPDHLYNHKFKFKNKYTHQTGCLSTPSKEQFTGHEFDTERFMAEYINYYTGSTINLEDKQKLNEEFRIEEVQ